VTAIELMPLSDVPGPRNWGYDGVLPFAPDRVFGTPDDLRSLVDTAHGLGLMVFLDVVYNHFGPDGAYIHAFAKDFFREDLTTPWGASIDFRRPEVKDYFIQNALYWVNEFRMDGLRFDAVHAISEEDFLRDMAAAIRASAGSRHVHLVLEHENNRAALLVPPLYDAQWADDLHHCMHVLLTGESEGYYGDFQDATTLLARCLSHGFAYEGQVAPHLGRPRGEPSGHLATTAFVICLQNHDQIGNRAFGERLTSLADPAGLRAATVLLLLSPFIPLLFMGEEWASTSPFQFFTSHNEELAGLVDAGRRNEFKAFAAFQDEAVRDRIPAPNAESTFERSRPERTDPAHATWISQLLQLRREHIVPGLPGCRSLGATVLADKAVRGDWAMGTEQTLSIILNLGSAVLETGQPEGRSLFVTPGATAARLPPNSIVVLLA
jgi:malto-oligosyltrehalose trehalohydrolase